MTYAIGSTAPGSRARPSCRRNFLARVQNIIYGQRANADSNTQFRLDFRQRPRLRDGVRFARQGRLSVELWGGGRRRRNRDGRTHRQGSGGARWNAWWSRPSAICPTCRGSAFDGGHWCACYGDRCDVTYGDGGIPRRLRLYDGRARRTRGRQNVVGDRENGGASYAVGRVAECRRRDSRRR